MKKIALTFFFLISISCFAQFSKTHYIPPLTASSNKIVDDHYIYISTPNSNNDGYNDYWSVKGINANFYSNSTIYIYDRYGKLLKQWIPSKSEGWDGTFNEIPMPTDDYWYTIKLEDGREAKGHFSLKR